MVEKYKNLIRDRKTVEDTTTIERYSQLMEHYQRCHNTSSNGATRDFSKGGAQKSDLRNNGSKVKASSKTNRDKTEVQEIEITNTSDIAAEMPKAAVKTEDRTKSKPKLNAKDKSGSKKAWGETKAELKASSNSDLKKDSSSQEAKDVSKAKTKTTSAEFKKKTPVPVEKGFSENNFPAQE